MRSYWITQMGPKSDNKTLEKTEEDPGTQKGSHVKTEAEIGVNDHKPGSAWSFQRAGRAKEAFSPGPSEGGLLCQYIDFGLVASRKNKFLLFKSLSL